MVGPIPSVESYIGKLDNSKDSTKYHKMPDGNIMPVDHFGGPFKNGSSIDKFGKHNKSNPIVDVFGCHACRWVNTDLCSHRGDVTHMKPHCNGICSQRLTIPRQLHDEGVKMTGKQMLQVRALMDAEFFSKYVQDAALSGKRDINDVFAWEKLKADILKDMRKQDEGSKLTLRKEVLNPLELGKLLRETKDVVVDSNFESDDKRDDFEHSPGDSD